MTHPHGLDLTNLPKTPATPADLKAAIKEHDSKTEAAPKEELVPRRLEIKLRYPAPDTGEVLRESVYSVVPDAEMRQSIQKGMALICGGLALDAEAVARNMAISHLAICLDGASEEMTKYINEDDGLLAALYQECRKHCDRFFPGNTAAGGNASQRPTFSIDSALSPEDPA